MFKAGAGVLPTQIDTSSEGAKYALVAGGTAAALTAAAQTGTVATAPTIPVTVPVSTLTVGGVAFKYGSIKRMVEIETGSAAMSMLKMTDDQGNKLDPTIVRRVSNIVGALNGALEFVQLNTEIIQKLIIIAEINFAFNAGLRNINRAFFQQVDNAEESFKKTDLRM